MQIEVKNIRNQRGTEGIGFCGTLYINGAKRGEVYDTANGGPLHYDDYKASKEIDDYAKTFPSEFDFEHGDHLVNVIVSRAQMAADITRKMKKQLGYVDVAGKLCMTNTIKHPDVEMVKKSWMANTASAAKLGVKRWITDASELIELEIANKPEYYAHPALAGTAPGKTADVAPTALKLNPTKPAQPVLGSKLDRCRNLYAANSSLSRGDMIKLFVSQADCTAAGAGTYYQKLKSGS